MFIQGQRVKHAVYGKGTVVAVEDSVMQCPVSNFPHTVLPGHTDQVNIGVRFDKGGPMGWAECGHHPRPRNHNIKELVPIAA